ncbi:LLM class F420-dependent oxidoreductase [Mycobacterium sp. OAE908]|uniref:LLM class F420-dependent oxidoreductase n=1 Tax=Mycobacterium sp. OAE908 TaxID=2817899 RepID=UPI001AE30905
MLATDAQHAVALLDEAEHLGFDSVWAADHVVMPASYKSIHPYGNAPYVPPTVPFPEPLTWLAFAAGVTERIRLCTGVLVLSQRNPVVLAKTAATLDVLSNGRLTLGVGLGWNKEEKLATGLVPVGIGARTEEYVHAMRQLWTNQPATFDGTHCSFNEVHCLPAPAQRSVPIVIGGHTLKAAARAGRVGDGFFAWDVGPESLPPLIAEVRRSARACGRDPNAIELSAGGTDIKPADLERYAELGVTRVVLPVITSLGELAEEYKCRS